MNPRCSFNRSKLHSKKTGTSSLREVLFGLSRYDKRHIEIQVS